ncbi:MAG TPA: hypothetical protein VGP17_02605 [Solirubrobacteraceae bacterium]|jgi:hypothetical protein|nr:hypothetical protein [Solirubrobacteraceae bacterium]
MGTSSEFAPKERQQRGQRHDRPATAQQAGSPPIDLQRAAGNRALAQLLGPPRLSLARNIIFEGKPITPYSRDVVSLFATYVAPELESEKLKARGIKTRLVKFIRDGHDSPYDRATFAKAFMSWLGTQTRKVKGGGEVPVLREFEVMKMGRPSWPAELKVSKGVAAGDNLRHVVRNATLKRALDIEVKKVKAADAKEHFREIAEHLGINPKESDTVDQIVGAIYKLVYLNPKNLFAGEGTTNQVIGFSADTVRQYGEELVESEDDLILARRVIDEVVGRVEGAAKRVRAGSDTHKQQVVEGIAETVGQAIQSIADKDGMVLSKNAGDMVVDIGLGLGFDLVDGRVPEDTADYAERQKNLLQVETELDAFIRSGGDGSLTNIFKMFLGLA